MSAARLCFNCAWAVPVLPDAWHALSAEASMAIRLILEVEGRNMTKPKP